MVAFIHVAICGVLTTSVESATTLIGDTHSFTTNADTDGRSEIKETQHATLDKNFDATPLYMSRKSQRDVRFDLQTTTTGSRSLIHDIETQGSGNLRATSSRNGSIPNPTRLLTPKYNRISTTNTPNNDDSHAELRVSESSLSGRGKAKVNDSPKKERKTVRFAGTKDTADAGSSNKNSGISFKDPNFAKGHVKIPGTRDSISLAQADRFTSKSLYTAATKDTADAGSSNKNSGISFKDPNFAKGHVKIPGTRDSISLAQADRFKSKSLFTAAWPILPLKKPNQNSPIPFKDVPNKTLRIAESTTIRPQEKKPRFFKKFWSFGKRKTHEVDSRQDGSANNLKKAKAALGSLYSNVGYQRPEKEEP
ncbi:unnamed protein product [Albugo candida]|uniref:RxLR effector protein n=1 Tax=Albugo candida TaxID=65357 RepID=A0A024FTF8_9STRA|nr:unnamed protein product [Albugo candida]|eukprot:CCI10306.1 unnamed protein product [Albugo candida]